ncbi:MAG TPA: hypothetical protein PKH94_04660 [Bacteroidales bacterium]|nr:hypothetical protein [Bacteroidales bacterium]HNS46510.1 hypothetical protein [Bacteroidales bacterium]
MGVDIKLPIGLMFSIFGVLLTIYGLITRADKVLYEPSFGVNVNLWVGLFMLVFGLAMLIMALVERKRAKKV